MLGNGFFGNVKCIANEFVGLTFYNEVHNFDFPMGKVKPSTIAFNQTFNTLARFKKKEVLFSRFIYGRLYVNNCHDQEPGIGERVFQYLEVPKENYDWKCDPA